MIKEAYVSFEVAKLLKEKGFDERSFASYDLKSQLQEGYGYWNKTPIWYAAPTHQMAMKWLREVHKIDIDIDAHCGMLGTRCYVAYVSTYKPYKLTDTDKKFGLTEDDVKHRLVQSKRNTRIPSKSEIIPAHESFDTYEEAVEAALKYVLENLI